MQTADGHSYVNTQRSCTAETLWRNGKHAVQKGLQSALLAGNFTDIFMSFDVIQGKMRQVMDFYTAYGLCRVFGFRMS